jgi:histidyl-tRNA synthetase
VSGVGISFGADRIYDVMEQLDGYPKEADITTKVFFVNFGEAEQAWCLPLIQKLRQAGISAEIYPEAAKLKKQMIYANSRNIPFVAMVGEEEMNSGRITLKDMEKGNQETLSRDELLERMKE